jgi:lipid-binding SYLF domain-containing protein
MRKDPRRFIACLPAACLSAAALLVPGCSAPPMSERMTDAIGTLSRVQSSPQPVDADVLRGARGIAIVDETQAGLVISGAGGRGILMRRNGSEWSAPCAIKVEGFGVGLTAGGEGRSLVIVFSTDEALDAFVADGSYFMAQAQGTFGDSHGRTREPVQSSDQVHAYAVADGVYGTAALGGIGFKIDTEANARQYGAEVTQWDILDGKAPRPAGHTALVSRIERAVERTDTARPDEAAASHEPSEK